MSDRGVIFDMDGVLVDSYDAHYESWRLLGKDNGLNVTDEMFAASFGRTSREIIRAWWGSTVTDEQVAQWDQLKEAYYRDILEKAFPAMDGASELLNSLHEAGFKLAIGSSGPPENIAVVRRCLRGAEHFNTSVSCLDVTHGKPHPEVFLRAGQKLHLKPAQCLVVEDARHGVEAARRAGMAVIAITGTTSRAELSAADLVIDSHRELTPQIVADIIDRRAC